MSSESLALSLRGVTKAYRVGAPSPTTLTDAVADRLRRRWRDRATEVLALRDVELEIGQGEAVGIIGPNGAGKSTLLKVISRIVAPTRGRIEVYGRVGSLLEVGTGFNPELTGRENIYLNGALMGMKRAQIARQFDSIIEFAGVERFLETPVKWYSTGMHVRLAFAVAAHLDPDILLVDEVLSVGDDEFRRRCLETLRTTSAERDRTVLFVSHNMSAVQSLCDRGVVLRSGQVDYDGPTPEAVKRYIETEEGSAASNGSRRGQRTAANQSMVRLNPSDRSI